MSKRLAKTALNPAVTLETARGKVCSQMAMVNIALFCRKRHRNARIVDCRRA